MHLNSIKSIDRQINYTECGGNNGNAYPLPSIPIFFLIILILTDRSGAVRVS